MEWVRGHRRSIERQQRAGSGQAEIRTDEAAINALVLGIQMALGPRLRGDERILVLSLITA
jgi:hypothetical protein